MIKAVIFDIDNTLYSYDENHIYGMEALAVYCRDSFGITTDEMQACYRKAGRIMTDRIGTDTAAIHSRMLRMQCMLELLEQPLFPHARNMYHAYWDTFIQHIQSNPGILEFMKELKKRKIRIGIGTDMTAYVQYRKLEGQYRVWTCLPYEDTRLIEVYRIEVEPGGIYVSGSHGEKTREYLVVTEGVLTVECHGQSCQIRKDQVFKFETDQDHIYRNESGEKACCTCFFLDYHGKQ